MTFRVISEDKLNRASSCLHGAARIMEKWANVIERYDIHGQRVDDVKSLTHLAKTYTSIAMEIDQEKENPRDRLVIYVNDDGQTSIAPMPGYRPIGLGPCNKCGVGYVDDGGRCTHCDGKDKQQ